MAKKFVYAKGYDGISDFVYVDLLPDVKRSRQFNVNVIISLTIAVVLSFVLIYIPYSSQTVVYEEANGLNNDLKHELLLTQEEYRGYEIDLNSIAFEAKIDKVFALQQDFNAYKDDIEIIVDLFDGTITHINYDAENSVIRVTVVMTSDLNYDPLNNSFLNVTWVTSSTFPTPTQQADAILYSSVFTLGVE